jgi:hypothetical protein
MRPIDYRIAIVRCAGWSVKAPYAKKARRKSNNGYVAGMVAMLAGTKI